MKQLKNINWNHLYFFYEVARLQSIKKVSELTGNSPSTISEQISRLEQQFDVKLFHRTRGGLLLTQRGLDLYEHAQVMFSEGYRVLEKFSSNEMGGYPVTIGVDFGISDPISAEFLALYWDNYAQYGVVNTIQQPDHDVLIQNLVQGNIDWGISLTPSKRKSLVSYPLSSFSMSFCCSKEVFDRFRVKKEILRFLPYMELAFDHPIKRRINMYLRSIGAPLNEQCHTDNYTYMLSLLKKGRVFSLLPQSVIRTHSDLKGFQTDKPLDFTVYVIWKKSQEDLISISTLKNLVTTKVRYSKLNPYLQLEVSGVPEGLLRKKGK
jgi:DNA-binding transcriptional LysR family regulator